MILGRAGASEALIYFILLCLVVLSTGRLSIADPEGPISDSSAGQAAARRVQNCYSELTLLESFQSARSENLPSHLIEQRKACVFHHARRSVLRKWREGKKRMHRGKRPLLRNFEILLDGASCSLPDGSAAFLVENGNLVIIRVDWPQGGGSVCTLKRQGSRLSGSYVNSFGQRGVLTLRINKGTMSGNWSALSTIGSGILTFYDCDFAIRLIKPSRLSK